jgi:demethylmenaquinone methyltransferase/2-methoxy-6-polyprenyl-1,4-benzoquinol methylase
VTDIYDPHFVESLFDEMSATFDVVNYLSSFGFSQRWRKQFVRHASLRPGLRVAELMCGMGECWAAIAKPISPGGRLLALDFSSGMLNGAEKRTARFPDLQISLCKQDALANNLDDESVDCVLCCFGIKTLSDAQQDRLASEIRRILKPRGTFSLIEISVPAGWWLEGMYMVYLKHIIPWIGRLLLGNPENYRLLGIYTERFRDCRVFLEKLASRGLQVTYHRYFYGCATGVSGVKA